jgi:hypothetical protein
MSHILMLILKLICHMLKMAISQLTIPTIIHKERWLDVGLDMQVQERKVLSIEEDCQRGKRQLGNLGQKDEFLTGSDHLGDVATVTGNHPQQKDRGNLDQREDQLNDAVTGNHLLVSLLENHTGNPLIVNHGQSSVVTVAGNLLQERRLLFIGSIDLSKGRHLGNHPNGPIKDLTESQ